MLAEGKRDKGGVIFSELKYALLLIAQGFVPMKIDTVLFVTQDILTLARPRVGYEVGAERREAG